jgi:hypothetical protein
MTPAPACAGRTRCPPHPAVPKAPPASPAVGRGVLDCRLRRKDTWGAGMTLGPPHPASLDGWPPSPARGEADWVLAYAGRTLWPPHPAVPWAPPASPAVGRGVLGSCLRGKETKGHTQRSLGSCLRRNDTCWISACAGMTLWPPHPAVPWAPPASPAVGRGGLDSCLRGNDTWGPPHPAVPWAPPASPAVGRGGLDCCLRRKDTKGHTQRSLDSCFRRDDTCWVPACAGRTLGPRSRPGLRRCLRPGRALPRWGEAKCFFRLNGLYPPEVSATICGVRPTFPAYKL